MQLLNEHVLSPNTPLQLAYRQASALVGAAWKSVYPALEPLVERTVVAIQNSPDVVVLGFVLTVLVVAVQVMFGIFFLIMGLGRRGEAVDGW